MDYITIEILFYIFFASIIVDFITGVLVALKEGRLKSRTCRNGMFQSIGECIVLLTFVFIAYLIPSISIVLSSFTIGFIFKEGLSICENLTKLDVWIPTSILKGLEVGKDKIDKGEF